jgi:peptidoglycan hydrolase CwlO-like protein
MEQENEQPVYSRGAGGSTLTWILAAVVAVAGVAAGFGYLSRERRQMRELESTNQALSSSLTQMKTQFQSQLDTLNQQVRERAAQENSPARRAVGEASGNVRPQTRLQPRRVAAEDPRIKQMQSKLADQERALNETRQDLQGKLDSTRDQLSGSLESTRSELSGSIARTHDDLVALQKRGERNYYEFQITRSKEFHRVGPVSVSLRKANTKRKSYDLALFVNDNELQKKSVNLFEPIWINLEDRPQPVELIVNQISKDQIQGYISEPKYKRSELGDTTAAVPASNQTPALKTAQ